MELAHLLHLPNGDRDNRVLKFNLKQLVGLANGNNFALLPPRNLVLRQVNSQFDSVVGVNNSVHCLSV